MMQKITETMDEVYELLHEAKEHIGMAARWKNESPTLSGAYQDSAYALENQAEKLYMALRESVEKKIDELTKPLWEYHKMRYLDKMAKIRTLHSQYPKM